MYYHDNSLILTYVFLPLSEKSIYIRRQFYIVYVANKKIVYFSVTIGSDKICM